MQDIVSLWYTTLRYLEQQRGLGYVRNFRIINGHTGISIGVTDDIINSFKICLALIATIKLVRKYYLTLDISHLLQQRKTKPNEKLIFLSLCRFTKFAWD